MPEQRVGVINPLEVIKPDIEEAISGRRLDFHLLYGDAGVICNSENHQVKYVLYAGMENPYIIKLSSIYPFTGEEDLDLITKLRKIRYRM